MVGLLTITSTVFSNATVLGPPPGFSSGEGGFEQSSGGGGFIVYLTMFVWTTGLLMKIPEAAFEAVVVCELPR